MTTAWERLTQGLLRLADRDQKTPCQAPRRDRWTSDDAGEREWAAHVCRSLACPLLEACTATADETKERHGVFGGVDRTASGEARCSLIGGLDALAHIHRNVRDAVARGAVELCELWNLVVGPDNVGREVHDSVAVEIGPDKAVEALSGLEIDEPTGNPLCHPGGHPLDARGAEDNLSSCCWRLARVDAFVCERRRGREDDRRRDGEACQRNSRRDLHAQPLFADAVIPTTEAGVAPTLPGYAGVYMAQPGPRQ